MTHHNHQHKKIVSQITLDSFGFQNELNSNPDKDPSLFNTPIFCKPFVKWAGGKRPLLPKLSVLAPAKYNRYFEPFIGAGALFFHLLSNSNNNNCNNDYNNDFNAFISDINADLINIYIAIKDHVDELIHLLTQYETDFNVSKSVDESAKKFYENLRHAYNHDSNSVTISVQRAAQFIALNETCFMDFIALIVKENLMFQLLNTKCLVIFATVII